MAHPLIEDSGGVILVKTELEVDVRIEGPMRLTQQPPLPVGILFAQFGLRFEEPFAPLHVAILHHLAGGAGIVLHEPPPFHIDIPLLFNMNDLTYAPRTDNVSNGQLVRLATMLRPHLNHLLRGLHSIAGVYGF